MKDIYSLPSQTIVFLGPEDDGSGEAMEYVLALTKIGLC